MWHELPSYLCCSWCLWANLAGHNRIVCFKFFIPQWGLPQSLHSEGGEGRAWSPKGNEPFERANRSWKVSFNLKTWIIMNLIRVAGGWNLQPQRWRKKRLQKHLKSRKWRRKTVLLWLGIPNLWIYGQETAVSDDEMDEAGGQRCYCFIFGAISSMSGWEGWRSHESGAGCSDLVWNLDKWQ